MGDDGWDLPKTPTCFTINYQLSHGFLIDYGMPMFESLMGTYKFGNKDTMAFRAALFVKVRFERMYEGRCF